MMKTRIGCLILVSLLVILLTACRAANASASINAPIEGSTAQIVEFYNNHVNALKTADRITITKHEQCEDIANVSANQDETITETFVNGKGTQDAQLYLNDFLPAHGESFVSDLIASDVQSAACTQQGNGWRIQLAINSEVFSCGNEPEKLIEAMLSNGIIVATLNAEGKVMALTHRFEYVEKAGESVIKDQLVRFEYQFIW